MTENQLQFEVTLGGKPISYYVGKRVRVTHTNYLKYVTVGTVEPEPEDPFWHLKVTRDDGTTAIWIPQKTLRVEALDD